MTVIFSYGNKKKQQEIKLGHKGIVLQITAKCVVNR